MAFALSGSIITQTGTDGNLAGLAGIAGVSRVITGGVSHYFMGTLMLRVAGTLTHNPDTECLVFGDTANQALIVQSGGVYNYGVEALSGGVPAYSKNTGIRFTSGQPLWYEGFNGSGRCPLVVQANGRLNWRGGIMSFQAAGWFFAGASTILIRQGFAYVNAPSAASGRGALCTITSQNMDIDGLRVTGRAELNVRNSLGSSVVKGVVTEHGPFGFSFDTDVAIPAFVTLDDLDVVGRGATVSDYFYSSSGSATGDADVFKIRIRNAARGSEGTYRGGNGGLRERCIWEQVQSVRFALSRATGGAVSGAVVHVRDTNNGQRRNGFGFDYVSDRVYLAASSASGQVEFDILASVIVDAVSGSPGGSIVDFRSRSGTSADDFGFNVWSYAALPTSGSFIAKGTGVKSVPVTLFADPAVTLSEAAALEKLASSITVSTEGSGTITVIANSTLDDIYDALKAWKIRPIQAQVEFPTIATQPVFADGSTLASAMNIVVSAEVALTRGAKFQSIRTTGIVTVNGTFDGGIIDANGDSYLTFDGIDSWQVYGDAARTALLESGTGAQIFRFNYAGGTTYYLTLVAGGTTYFMTSTPAASGETVVSLETPALLLTLQGLVNQRPTLPQIEASSALAKRSDLTVVNNGVKLASLGIPHTSNLL